MLLEVLVPAIISAVTPYAKKGLEKIVEEAGKEGWAERKAIWDKVKGLFVEDELTLLNLFKESETDETTKLKLETKLETHLQLNPEIVGELDELVKKVQEIEKKNTSNITNEDIKGNSEIENTIEQSVNSATNNESTITNRNVENSKIINRVKQS